MSVHRAGRAEDDHRGAVAPRVEDRHTRMHQADIGVQRHGHRLFRYFTVAVGDRDRVLFVQADHHLRIVVAEIIDDAVVKSAIAGTGHQGDIFEVEPSGHFGNDVAAPLHLRFSEILRPVDLGLGLASFRLGGFAGDFCFHWIPSSYGSHCAVKLGYTRRPFFRAMASDYSLLGFADMDEL